MINLNYKEKLNNFKKKSDNLKDKGLSNLLYLMISNRWWVLKLMGLISLVVKILIMLEIHLKIQFNKKINLIINILFLKHFKDWIM
jgi:hypothetical protein